VEEKHGKGRVQVEVWEMEVVKQVAHAYRTDYEELEAELLGRLLELKIKHQAQARKWRAYVARSLYNAANNFVRNKNLRESKMQSLEPDDPEDGRPALANLLAAPEESIDLRTDLARLREDLSPQLRQVWDLLIEENGNVSAVARKLGRPRKSLDYWIGKLRQLLKNRAL
jgi:DNA-directed RNA polymerase specialized sigma24 family protein